MARYAGNIGFVKTIEKSPGVHIDIAEEHKAFGDVTQNNFKWNPTNESTNDNIAINDVISIVADSYIWENYSKMRYVCYMGERWKISNIQTVRPRLIINIGGVWNGPTP